jgi:hypothetical protein
VRVHLAAEHAFELETAYFAFEPLRVLADVLGGGFVALPLGQLQKLLGIADALGGAIDLRDVGAETGPLLTELLGPVRLRPDGRVFELSAYLFEALFLAIVFKETPVTRRCARPGL